MTAQRAADTARIVVGVDGSDSARAALAWAVRQAALTGAIVDAVTAWQIPASYGWVLVDEGPDLEGLAVTMLKKAIDEAASLAPDVEIRPCVAQENAARALLDAAKGADLLVVGSRGHAGFAEALLGSVGQYCVHHADCPVVIVRAPHTHK